MIINLLTENEKKYIKTHSYKASEILFYENDICESVGIVLEGEIKIASMTFKGNEIVYNSLTKGKMFGNNLIFSSDNKYRGDVKATKNSKVALIDKGSLLTILMNNKSFLKEYLTIHSEFAKSLNTKIKLLSFDNAKERLLYYLFINDNHLIYKSVTSLAQELCLSREAASRLLSRLEKEKIIIKRKHEIILLDDAF